MTDTNTTTLEEVSLQNIQKAYKSKDKDLSRKLHEKRVEQKSTNDSHDSDNDDSTIEIIGLPKENHKKLADYVKSIIYGGLDGIITTFAVVAGVQGARLKPEVILVLGFANLVADGLSMGVGDYLSESAEHDFAKSEREREKWEFDNFKQGEIDEMIEIYKNKGITHEDASLILNTMAKYPDFFIDHMMIQELELNPPDSEVSPVKNGLVTMLSFLCFGCVPLFSYVIIIPLHNKNGKIISFIVSIILTIICLAVLGFIKGKITESNVWKSSSFVMLNGSLAAGASYLIGFSLAAATGIKHA